VAAGWGIQRTIQKLELDHIAQHIGSSTWRLVTAAEQVNYRTIWWVLYALLLCSYNVQWIHVLYQQDHSEKVEFCQWFLQQCAGRPSSPHVFTTVTGEAWFIRYSIMNARSQHNWQDIDTNNDF
jgi:hypothetical protein